MIFGEVGGDTEGVSFCSSPPYGGQEDEKALD